ncbi:MAG: HAD-IA family hydrolase [Kiritimatiellaeota bacterium]|nr:HAD-IA family hydrolase [Kiritimatiellota bacterium]
MNRIVICDLDGTLIDSRADLAAAVNKVRAEHGLEPISVDTATSYVGDGVRKLVERALSEAPDVDLDDAVVSMRRHYSRGMLDATSVYPTVLEGLAMLRDAGFKLCVATNKPREACEKIVEALGLSQCFDVVLGGCSDYPLKPDPAMLILAMEKTGTNAEDSWIIGDNHTDLASGKRAGIKRCYAEYGFGSLGEEAFDLKVDSFAEFADFACSR